LGAGSLLPETRKHGSTGVVVAMALGVAMIFILTRFV
jgi:hypothetical protein